MLTWSPPLVAEAPVSFPGIYKARYLIWGADGGSWMGSVFRRSPSTMGTASMCAPENIWMYLNSYIHR